MSEWVGGWMGRGVDGGVSGTLLRRGIGASRIFISAVVPADSATVVMAVDTAVAGGVLRTSFTKFSVDPG